CSTPAGSGTVNAGGSYAIPMYPSASTAAVSPSSITTGAAGTNLVVPADVEAGSDGTWVNSRSYGAFNLGQNLSFSRTGIEASLATSLNSSIFDVVQNVNTGTTTSACRLVANSTTTATANYGELCMNGSGFSGTGRYNAPNMVRLDSLGVDLWLGTASAN